MKKNLLEWIVFGVSLALIAGVIGVLAYEHMVRTNDPPAFSVSVGETRATAAGFAVQLRVRNTGDRTAERVHVEVTLDDHETARAVVEYVPYRSARNVWVTFPRDPRGRNLQARVVGYEEP